MATTFDDLLCLKASQALRLRIRVRVALCKIALAERSDTAEGKKEDKKRSAIKSVLKHMLVELRKKSPNRLTLRMMVVQMATIQAQPIMPFESGGVVVEAQLYTTPPEFNEIKEAIITLNKGNES